MSQIEFGKLIRNLLNYTGTKNYALALELGYDVSYISKLLSSKIYPASKNANAICQKIASFVTKESTESARHAISKFLHIDIPTDLEKQEAITFFQNQIESCLFEAYLYSTEKNKTEKNPENTEVDRNVFSPANSYTLIHPRLRREFLRIPLEGDVTKENPLDLIILANLSELSRDDKLHLAGIKKGDIDQIRPELMHFRLILSITETKKENLIFDPILFMYLVTNFSSATFKIYALNYTFYSFVMSAKQHFAHIVLPGKDGKCLIATTSEDEKVINVTYDMMDEMISTNCYPVFSEYTVTEMIGSKWYMRSIIGKNIRILIGTINEFFLPHDIFEKLADEYFADSPEILDELKNINIVLNNATYNSDIQILLYGQTLNNYALTGELNFFNKIIKVSISDRIAHIKNMIHLLENYPNIKIKIIKGYFIEEFKQYDNPSCFLSSTANYLRINSKYTDKTLLVIKDSKLSRTFDRFFAEAWDNRGDVVADSGIIPMIELSLNYIELLDDDRIL